MSAAAASMEAAAHRIQPGGQRGAATRPCIARRSSMRHQEIGDEPVALLAAGHETTTTTLA
ncbi:hypothetical protein [Nocardia gipuzkoensis]|uniref:hypothetical protein n=1 Tax=Nocardia gipuzkoensis TaxID=2749991 RepID=UPI0015EF5700|nr:hypothetical protein [Nocardia gipuzkoensis]